MAAFPLRNCSEGLLIKLTAAELQAQEAEPSLKPQEAEAEKEEQREEL